MKLTFTQSMKVSWVKGAIISYLPIPQNAPWVKDAIIKLLPEVYLDTLGNYAIIE
jgi:hypothetical protein